MNKEQIIEVIKNRYEFWKDEKEKEYKKYGETSFYDYSDGHTSAFGALLEKIKTMEDKDA